MEKSNPGFYSNNRNKKPYRFYLKGPMFKEHEGGMVKDITIDFFNLLRKVSESLSAQSAPNMIREEVSPDIKKRIIRSPENRIANLVVTEDHRKLMAVSFFCFDLEPVYLRNFLKGFKELFGKVDVQFSPNLITFYWDNPIESIYRMFELAHYLCFLGPIED